MNVQEPTSTSGESELRPSRADAVTVAVFLVMLCIPGMLALLGFAKPDAAFIASNEERFPFVAPPITRGALATGGWERDFERQVADAFPLRTQLLALTDYPRFVWFGQSTTPEVVRGSNGWLFLGLEEKQYVTRTWNPSDAELERIASVYETRAKWCAAHGIAYVFVIAPNKTTIYPLEAPAWYRPTPPTPLDRLLPMLRARRVLTIDVRNALRSAAPRGEVYSRGDTHWNEVGGYVAYRVIVAALARAGVRDAVVPKGSHVVTTRGDLLNLSGVGTWIPDHLAVMDFPNRAHPADTTPYAREAAAQSFGIQASAVDAPLPVGVIFGDSFSSRLTEFFAQDFSRTITLSQASNETPHFDRKIVLQAHANVVVQELVERSLVAGAKFVPFERP